LKHLGRALELDADFLLWFEPEEPQLAKQQLQEKIDQKSESQKADGRHLLLWGRAIGASERELMSGLKWIQLDLIESPEAEKGFARRLKDNFKLLADGIETAAEVGNSSE